MDIEKLKYQAQDKALHIADVMGCSFIALADRYGKEQYEEFQTKEDAVQFLEYGSDNCEHMDIAVIDCKTHKMIWYNDFLGKKVCQNRVDLFIRKHCP